MPKFEIIIFASLAIVLFLTLTYLLIGLFSKIGQSSKAKYSKTMDDLEQDRSFKL